MLSWRLPSVEALRRYAAERDRLAAWQTTAGIGPPPRGFIENTGSGRLGVGQETFAAARDAVRAWKMFPGGWLFVEPAEPQQVGQTVAVVVRCLGAWTVNCCRAVDVTDEPRRFAFTYATVDDHAVAGAERFSVEWRDNDEVWFDVRSVSRPRDWRVWLAYPWFRRLQVRFGRESPECLRRAVEKRLRR